MTMYRDYIPRKDVELEMFARKLYDYAMTNAVRWAVSLPEEFLKVPLDAFEKTLEVFREVNHGKIDTLNKNNAKKELVRQLRLYIQGLIIRNSKVTDKDKVMMGLPLRNASPTTHPVPTTHPHIDAVSTGRGSHRVTAINTDTLNKKKPVFVTSVAYAYRMRRADEPLFRAADMPSVIQTSTEKIFRYTESQYGMVVDYAVAYVNSTNKLGPWSEVTSLLITK
jgi:hypothetical protein